MTDDERTNDSEAPRLPRPRHKPWVMAFLALVIFVTGFVAGAGAAAVLLLQQAQFAVHHPRETAERVAKRLTRVLDLDAKQAAEVRRIILERQRALWRIRRYVQPLVMAQLRRVCDDIAAVLNPEQEKKWRKMFARLEERWLPPPPPDEEAQGAGKPAS